LEKETLDTIRPKTRTTELLCYVELLETTKPYLSNVMRIPAVHSCILFAEKLDISPNFLHVVVDEWLHLEFTDKELCERVLETGNWLRVAWDFAMARRLKQSRHVLSADKTIHELEEEQEEEIQLFGTAISSSSSSLLLDSKKHDNIRTFNNFQKAKIKSTYWESLDCVPQVIKTMRRDFESAVTSSSKWEELEDFEVSGNCIIFLCLKKY
jgi:hypothetical protein